MEVMEVKKEVSVEDRFIDFKWTDIIIYLTKLYKDPVDKIIKKASEELVGRAYRSDADLIFLYGVIRSDILKYFELRGYDMDHIDFGFSDITNNTRFHPNIHIDNLYTALAFNGFFFNYYEIKDKKTVNTPIGTMGKYGTIMINGEFYPNITFDLFMNGGTNI